MGPYWDKLVFTFVFIAILVVFELMALPNWGQLQKALDNPETIEEAIVRLIAAHNDAPDSHLSEGQSLHNHSHEDVIDHPERSIPTDKYSTAEVVVPLLLSGAANWSTTDMNITPLANGLNFENNADDSNESRAAVNLLFHDDLPFTPTFHILDFSFSMIREDASDQITLLIRSDTYGGEYVGFLFLDDYVDGLYRSDGSTTYTSDYDIGYSSDDRLYGRCRLVYDVVAETFSFYFGDNLIGTLDVPSTFNLDTGININLTRNDDTQALVFINIASLTWSVGSY